MFGVIHEIIMAMVISILIAFLATLYYQYVIGEISVNLDIVRMIFIICMISFGSYWLINKI
jgi:hypothetical protein